MKKILISAFIITSGFIQAQTIGSITFDGNIFCDGGTKTFVVEINNPLSLVYSIDLPTTSNNGNLMIYPSGNFPLPDSTNGTIEYYSFQAENYMGTITNDQMVSGETFDLSLLDGFSNSIPGTNYTVGPFDIYGAVSSAIDLSNVNICANGLPMDLSAYGIPAGGEFSWGNEQTNFFNPKAFYLESDAANNNNGASINYSVTNLAGCVGTTSSWFNFEIPPIVTVSSINSTTCGNATADAVANISSQNAPFNVFWSTGKEETVTGISQVNNLSSGAYYCTVTDNKGCNAVGTIKISDTDVNVTSVVNNETCMGTNDGLIDLTVTLGGGDVVSDVFWSNGITTEDMTGHKGEYSVEIHTANNCNYYDTYTLDRNQVNFSVVAATEYDCSIGGNSFINIDTSSTMGIASLVWKDASNVVVNSGNAPDINPPHAGVYTCTITDNYGCTKSWDITIGAFSDVDAYVVDVTKATCGNSDGAVDVVADNFAGEFTYWQWDNGMTTEDLTNVPAGTYTLEYRGTANPTCSGFITVEVPNERPYQPQICLLTVDTTTIYNTVIWEKDPNQNIDGFKVYRETTTYSEFEEVADVPFSDESLFIDNAASPVDRSWRYYITTYNACSESYPSYVHKTIHVVADDDGTGTGTFDVSWDDYEGLDYTNVNLWRYTEVNPTWTLVNTFANGVHHATDQPTDIVGLDYLVTFDLASPCTSTTVKANDWNSTRSNKTSKTSGFVPGGETGMGISDVDVQNGVISIYPNPTNQNIRIYIEKPETYKTIKVLNTKGQMVAELSVNNTLTIVDLSQFSNGIYFVQLISDTEVITNKIVKQ